MKNNRKNRKLIKMHTKRICERLVRQGQFESFKLEQRAEISPAFGGYCAFQPYAPGGKALKPCAIQYTGPYIVKINP